VHRQDVPVVIELPGRTSANLVAQVRARVDGIVLKQDVKEGSMVKAGQLLYQIDPAPYIAALDSARAMLANAQATVVSTTATVERYKELLPKNAISKMEYDNALALQGQAVANVASGKAAVQTATINLGYTKVVSPITGSLGITQVTPGAYVQASAATLMNTVQQIDPIKVDLTQSSVDGLRLRQDYASGKLKLNGPGQAKVTLILEDGTQYSGQGSLQFTDITVDQSTGSVTVRALFPNPDGVLLPGMFVRARIEEGVRENAMLVPAVGVTHDPQGNATALVVGPDNKVALRKLQVAGTNGEQWIVEGGLEEGDRVIVGGVQRAQPGATVQIAQVPAPQPAATVAAK
jgi:membrane fusion protein (multidrug efflux system)